MPDSKPCAACGAPFSRGNRISDEKWRKQVTCSRSCAVVYRAPSKAAMNRHWAIQQAKQKARAEAKRFAIQTRADELAAIERHLAENGITVCQPTVVEDDPVRGTQDRPQVQPGWRG